MSDVHIIKKYSNRRLYDTCLSTHITLQDIRDYVLKEVLFQVIEVKSGADITRNILLQIIQDTESEGKPIFSEASLRNIIRFYGPFQNMLGNFLEKSLESIVNVQNKSGLNDSETWLDFMTTQIPVMEKVMSEYLEHTKQLYTNTQNMFDLFSSFYPDKK